MIDTDIETAAELIELLADRPCECVHLVTPPMSCRDYWSGEPEQWCLVCAARQWHKEWTQEEE
jgi:hypothetical protein